MSKDRFEEKSVSPFEIGFNPVQEDLGPDRIEDVKELEHQFRLYKEDTGKYFNDLFKIGVRLASESERKEQKVSYIAIDGNRRTAVARKLRLPEVSIVIDKKAKPEDDVINLKRVVEGDKGYTPLFAARLVERMINQGLPKERIEAEYKGEVLNRMLAFIAAPKSLQDEVKRDPVQFTRVAKIAQTVLTKDPSGLSYAPYKDMKSKDAEAIMKMMYNRKDLNSEEIRKVAMQYRDNLLHGNLRISDSGDSFEAEFPWQEVGIDYDSLKTPEEIKNACNQAIDNLRTKRYEEINSNSYFNLALDFLMEKLNISSEDIAQALNVTLPYVNHLLSRDSHPSAENQASLLVELPRFGVPKNVVLQIWLLAVRDVKGGTKTRKAELVENYKFKGSKLLQNFLTDHELAQKDIVKEMSPKIGQTLISSVLNSRNMPTADLQGYIVAFLKSHSAKASFIEKWLDAVARDKIYYIMIKEKTSKKRREKIIKTVDEALGLNDI